jgi:hypothetical protein
MIIDENPWICIEFNPYFQFSDLNINLVVFVAPKAKGILCYRVVRVFGMLMTKCYSDSVVKLIIPQIQLHHFSI